MHQAFKYIVAGLWAITAACDQGPENPRSKGIYSVLQSEEYRLRERQQNVAYVYVKNALGSEYHTIAFPAAGRRGYVVFLANPRDGDITYSVPSESDGRFILDKPTYQEIVDKGYVTTPLQTYLQRHL
ncbi:MAG TPA: hypothetical protein VF645_06590 [Allosphingosinicella sp.]|jgi:hypothetical protein